ncbi:hypothetical protein BDQ12DRAFT_57975 [Crucibulum laeve]|uniref:Complex 1 LYR protein domain-containing protein n=1 Tax=Crucibulum laeve TaxID=68775 RepID=A0A5C3M266_9AGAR|nr:hypothetical protein BDQ12DRAFT_57975 [Crucibulum laeve]
MNLGATQESLAFRANLARLISPYRRVRPRVPFWQLGAHRVPTLWGLYRGLLKQSPTEQIRDRIQLLFRKNQHLTGTERTKEALEKGYKWLDMFTKAREGDEHLQLVLDRWSRILAVRADKAYWRGLALREVEWREKLRNRPILTGGYLLPSLSNGPLPRMKPQPLNVTLMILDRRRAREKRIARQGRFKEMLRDLRIEREFEEGLQKMERLNGREMELVFGGANFWEWEAPLKATLTDIQASFDRDLARANTPYPPEMLAAIAAAKREKIVNKTRERERERRGEILRSTLRRKRQGPPAHILTKMTPEERAMDNVVRTVSEGGYVGQVKRRMGMKLREPDAWKKEVSYDKKKELDRAAKEHTVEMEKRRQVEEERIKNLKT